MAFRVELPETYVSIAGPDFSTMNFGDVGDFVSDVGKSVVSIVPGVGQYIGTKEAVKGQKSAAEATRQGTEYAADVQYQMLQDILGMQQPFRDVGYFALPQLAYLATGTAPSLTYPDTGMAQPMAGQAAPTLGHIKSLAVTPGELGVAQSAAGEVATQGQAIPFQPMSLEASPLFQFQQELGEEAINRAAAARGLYGSSAALSQLSDFNRALAAEESQRQYGRLLDLVNIGRGATTASSAAQQGAGSTLSSLYQQQGMSLADIAANIGQTRGSYYSGMGNIGLTAAGGLIGGYFGGPLGAQAGAKAGQAAAF